MILEDCWDGILYVVTWPARAWRNRNRPAPTLVDSLAEAVANDRIKALNKMLAHERAERERLEAALADVSVDAAIEAKRHPAALEAKPTRSGPQDAPRPQDASDWEWHAQQVAKRRIFEGQAIDMGMIHATLDASKIRTEKIGDSSITYRASTVWDESIAAADAEIEAAMAALPPRISKSEPDNGWVQRPDGHWTHRCI